MKMLKYLDFIRENMNANNSHNYFIPSYEECKRIVDEHENFLFYEVKHEVEGFVVSVFNYRLANWTHFDKPVESDPNLKAFELRGLTFVWNKDGSLYNRYLMLDKFFNLDQVPDSAYSVVKNFKIKNVFNKEDGSVASFVRLPNGKVMGRSKTSFQSDQAIEIQKIYESDPNIKQFVDFCMDSDIVPIFEYVSPTNRIVVPYANTQLILLRLRDNKTGEYLDIDNYSKQLDGISVAASEETTLDDILTAKDIVEGKEGWIVQFENGKMVKIKTSWYIDRHRLFTEDLNRENTLISLILDETIDDVIAQIEEPTKKEEIEEIIDIVNNEMSILSNNIDKLMSNYKGDRKDFAINYRKDPLFGVCMGIIGGKDKIDSIKDFIRVKTRNLMQAKDWLKKAKDDFLNKKLSHN
jgi:T4 RnlA family RNA ligase